MYRATVAKQQPQRFGLARVAVDPYSDHLDCVDYASKEEFGEYLPLWDPKNTSVRAGKRIPLGAVMVAFDELSKSFIPEDVCEILREML